MRSLALKILISLACVIVLVMMFFFGDEIIPENNPTNAAQGEENYRDDFKFKPEKLIYDGTGDLDLLQGVTLKGYNAQDLKTMVFTRIYAGDTLSEKVIEYTAETKDGRARSTRALRLDNYSGPKITMPREIPKVIPGTIDGFASLLKAKDGYGVDDGFGNDMRDHVDVSYERDQRDSALIHYTVAFENMFGDRDVEKTDVVLSGVPARLILTASQITMNTGETFNPAYYVELAENADGGSALEQVLVRGRVDTSRPGDYSIIYDLEGQTATLEVNVIE